MKQIAILCLIFTSILGAQNVTYPANSGVMNVKDPKFGAKGDGKTDDTAAIQKAISEGLFKHGVVYLPDGVYLVTDTLKWCNGDNTSAKGWGPFLQMQGQSRAKTVILLGDNALGFADESKPKAVIATGSSGNHGNKKYVGGEGNEGFENHLRNFTVQVGKGNAGAIGIDFQGSNVAAMRGITIRGDGYCGLGLMRRDNGPSLVKDVAIEGFRFGIRGQQDLCQFTFEHINLSRQREVGIWVKGAIFSMRRIVSINRVPVIQVSGSALVNLFDSEFSGGSVGAAIELSGTSPKMLIRNLKTSGYQGSIQAKGEIITEPLIDEWLSSDAMGNQGPMAKTLGLKVRETPEFYDENIANWADAGNPSGKDDTAQIQAALDAGKATVYFHKGHYNITKSLVVPPTVKLLLGIGTSLDYKASSANEALFQLQGGGKSDLTVIDRFTVSAHSGLLVHHADSRELVLRDLMLFSAAAYRNEKDSGSLFIEDLATTLRIDHPTEVWARQLDLESKGEPKLDNKGGTVWALGWKTESGEMIARNSAGGKMELWGGLPYTFGVPLDSPMFVNEDSDIAMNFAGMSYVGGSNPFFDLIVRDTRDGKTMDFRRASLSSRGGGAMLPLYVSSNGATGQRKSSLKTVEAKVVGAGRLIRLPDFFGGAAKGGTEGNPVMVGGKPMWRIDQIWPDDFKKAANYKPMVWTGNAWRATEHKFGGASAKAEGGMANLSMRSAWGADGDVAGSKLGALVLISQADGKCILAGIARAGYWQGTDGASLEILQKSGQAMASVKSLPLPKDQDIDLKGVTTHLKKGDELIFTVKIAGWHTGITLDLKGLSVEYAQ